MSVQAILDDEQASLPSNPFKRTGFVVDFSYTIAIMFLETFLAAKSKMTSTERASITKALAVVKKYYLPK